MLVGWEEERNKEKRKSIHSRELSLSDESVEIGFCGGLRVEEAFLTSLEGMLNLWEETRPSRKQSHVMVNL